MSRPDFRAVGAAGDRSGPGAELHREGEREGAEGRDRCDWEWVPRGTRTAFLIAGLFGALLPGVQADAGPLVRDARWSRDPFSRVVAPPGARRDLVLVLDREEYDPLDTAGVLVIRFDAGKRDPGDLRLRLRLVREPREEGREPLLEEELGGLGGEHGDLTLGLERVPVGSHELRVTLADRAGAPIADAAVPLRKRVKRSQTREAERERVAVSVWPAEGAMEPEWPISTGVPFPQGALLDGSRVRLLDEKGVEMPCQTGVRATWNRHGSVRWLGLDFTGRLAPGGARYTLEFGRDVRRAPSPGMEVVEDDGDIRVSTGPLRFTVRKRGFNLIDEATVRGAVVSRQDSQAGLELTDHEGAVYRASGDPGVRVYVEETGPVRTTIRATGWYVKEGTAGGNPSPVLPTDRLCLHDTRITAFAGRTHVEVQHVLVITFDTHRVRLRHIGISQRVEGASTAALGLDGKAVAVPEPRPRSVRLYQPATVDAQVEEGDPSGPDFRVIAKGKRADGWVTLRGARGAMTLCVTDLWQLYPKELEVRGDRISFNIWPRHGRTYGGVDPMDPREIYKGWWCHTGPELAFPLPREVYEKEKAALGEEYVHEHERFANAQGVAIENDFILDFGAGGDDRDAARLNATYQYAPHAWAEPRWVCDTEVFGRMLPRDPRRFPTAEAYLEHAVSLRLAAQEHARDHGMFNHGCIHSDNSHFAKGTWGLDRVWKDHHGGPRMPWLLYARSGDPRHLRFARQNSRHVMNVDTVHYVTPGHDLAPPGSDPGEYRPHHEVGAHYGCYGFQHWGDRPCVDCMFVNGEYDQLFWNWYATGNRRALDVAMVWVEAIKSARVSGETGREFSSIGAELMEAYPATWDPGLLEVLDNIARAIGNAHFHFEKDDRKLGNHWLNMAPFVDRYLPFTGNENYRKRTLAWALDSSPYDGPRANTQALKYHETGDRSHLEECLADVYFLSLRYSPDPPRIGDRSAMYGWLKTIFRVTHWPAYLRALDEAGIDLFVARGKDGQRFPAGAAVVERSVDGKPGAVGVVEPGAEAVLLDEQVWYFRTGPDERKLEWTVTQRDGEGAVHVRTRDGSRIIAHRGADGHAVGGDGTIDAAVEPSTFYYLAVSGGPTVVPARHPLILARTVEEWFDPRSR